MKSLQIEIGEVRTLYRDGAVPGPRAEMISRMTFDRLQRLVDTDLNASDGDYTVEHLAVQPIQIALNEMSDEDIAQISAEAIFRTLLTAI